MYVERDEPRPMARREKDTNKDEEEEGADEPWGTLEELLLACAVNRHGAKSWDSISMELQKRTSHRHLNAFYSPPSCKRKYCDLRSRFTDVDEEDDEEGLKSMVDELKKLRVAELRREVERHDVSIEFLQLKVKRLEEEREQSFKPNEEKTDLPSVPDNREPKRNSPEDAARRSVSGEDSDYRENRSFNESNSTSNPKAKNRPQVGDKQELQHEPGTREPKTEGYEPEPGQTGSKPVSCCSLTLKLTDTVEERGNSDPADSKRVVRKGTKQRGGVQSSRKKKQRRRSCFPIASSSGEEEPEGDEVCPAAKQIATKSQSLIKILVILRSHPNGSLFERRLRSQETEKYRKMIRQHMDLQTVQSRLDKGFYLDFQHKFFRDLLLLFNNAIIFFPKNSPESIAARELRQLVTKEMATTICLPLKSDPKINQPIMFPARPNKIAPPPPIVVCRRRSSSTSVRVPSEAAKTREAEAKVKTKNLNHQLSDNKAQEKIIKQQGTKEKSTELSKSSSRTSKKVGDIKNHSEDDDDLETRVKRKESTKKKHGGSCHLKRVKQKYPSKEVEEDCSDDDDEDEVERREEEEEKKKSRDGSRRDGKKERDSDNKGERERRTDSRRERERESERRDQRERSTQVKRGRPPKRAAVESRRDGSRQKRGREGDESEVVAVAEDSGRSRKRYRR